MQVLIAIPAFVVMYLAWAVFSARRKFERKQIVLSRFSFAFRALFVSQVSFLALFIGLLVWSQGYILFAASVLIFANLVIGVLTILISLLIYGPLVKKIYPPQTQSQYLQVRSTASAVTMVAISTFLLLYSLSVSRPVIDQLVGAYATWSNTAWLIKFQQYSTDKDLAYWDIARDTHDLSLCDKISDELRRAQCYDQSDPNRNKYLETCTLNTAHGHDVVAQRSQSDCVVNKYIFQAFENGVDIQCNIISKDFSENSHIGYITDQCNSVAKLQEVIKSGIATKCRGFLTEPTLRGHWADSYMACVGNFVASAEQQSACDEYAHGSGSGKYPDRPPEYLMALARCPGYEESEHFGDTLDRFRGGNPPVYTEVN